MIFALTYDLNKEESSAAYKPLIDELRRRGAHRYQASAWLVNLNNKVEEVHAHFKRLMDANDSLWVSEVTSIHSGTGLQAGTAQWLQANPPSR
jgi:CRISPR/Cas system-associated endoribonuclease Cas2